MKSIRRNAFSLVELLIALAITGMLLAATMAALDVSYKSYQATTESASTNVVSRMVMHRVMGMIRTGTQFGPYPDDVLDPQTNPVVSTSMEFQSSYNQATGTSRITTLERRAQSDPERGPYELWCVERVYVNGAQTDAQEFPLITGVRDVSFTLEYDVGPRLRRATVDLTVSPNDFQDTKFDVDMDGPVIRLISTVQPRRIAAN
jgi:prepilin-type N-terminal cleavage/methylation domain-containing protein